MIKLIREKVYLIKILRIDVYLFLFMCGYYIGQVPTTQLIEDKICINELGFDSVYCVNFDTTSNVTESDRLIVLDRTTTIKNWQTILSTIPGVAISLFTGFWIDSYPSHIRYLLMIPCISIILQSLSLLLQCVYFKSELSLTYWSFLLMGIGGSIPLVLTCAFTYVARKTPQSHRSIRFALVELFLLTAQPAATALGAKILAMDSWFMADRRNYIGVFLTNAIIMLIAAIWVYSLLTDCDDDDDGTGNEPKPLENPIRPSIGQKANNEDSNEFASRKLVTRSMPSNSMFYKSTDKSDITTIIHKSSSLKSISSELSQDNNQQQQLANNNNQRNSRVSILPSTADDHKSNYCEAIKSIINISNVINTFKTCLRKRENGERAKVINICFAIFILFISLLSESYFGFQFTEKVFHWDYRYYSNINAALLLIQAFGAILGAALFKSLLNYQDSTLAGIATMSHLLSNLFKGIGYQESYITGYIVYGVSGMSIPSARSTLTQIIRYHEIAQVFTILSCIQAASPMVSSIFCTTIFKATMASMPGATYHAVCLLLFYPLGVFFWINVSQRRLKVQNDQRNLNRALSRGIEDLRITVAGQQQSDNNNGFVNYAFSSKF